jgi:uncharacterized protein (TIGR03382 family)
MTPLVDLGTEGSALVPGRSRAVGLCAAIGLFAGLGTTPAFAGDAQRPRVPVIHLGERCLTVVDQTATPVVHLDYTIVLEDTCAGTSPAPTQQFFAFCRPPPAGEALPQWITRADIEAAQEQQLLLPPIGSADVLEVAPEWTSCWWRVTTDDERRPVTCEAALEGVDWDVAALAPGAYAIAGYTYQPPLQLWSPRWGIFKLAPGPNPEDGPPVAALAQREAFVYADEVIALEVCTSAMAGSVLELELSPHEDEPAWQVLAANVPVEGEAVDVPWTPPPELLGSSVRLRVTVTDPLGRTGTLESPEPLHVLDVPRPGGGDGVPEPDPSEDPLDVCRDLDEPPKLPCTVPPQPLDPDEDEPELQAEPSSGCGCTHGPVPAVAWSWPLLWAAVRRRRRFTPP